MDLGYWLLFSGPTRPMDQDARLTIVAAQFSVENNFYGDGNYFAIDPRLTTYSEKASRGHGRAQRTVLLARVVVGWNGERKVI